MDMRIRPQPPARLTGHGPAPALPQASAGFRLPASTTANASPGGGQSATTLVAQSATTLAAQLHRGGQAGLAGLRSSPRDQVAQRRGRGLLGGLAQLQRELLGAAPDIAALHRLTALLEGEDGDEPELADAMRGLALRARIELLRRNMERGDPPGEPFPARQANVALMA